jgi:hypothetical protein
MDEESSGIVDPEALLVATLLLPEAVDSRLGENVAVWCRVYERLIHYQRLEAIIGRLPAARRGDAVDVAKGAGLHLATRRLAAALRVGHPEKTGAERSGTRAGRIRLPEGTAARSAFVANRLLFGTGYRADLVTLTSIRAHVFSGPELARLLATSASTVSRILADLRACGFLDRRGRRRAPGDELPGLAVSADSPVNIAAISDAHQVRDEALARTIERECDFEWDRLGETLTSRGR